MSEQPEILKAIDVAIANMKDGLRGAFRQQEHDGAETIIKTLSAHRARLAARPGDGALRALIEELRGEPGNCPFCKCDPYEYVDNGVGMEKVAVVCCDAGIGLFQHGDKQLVDEVNLRNRAAAAIEALTRSSAEPITDQEGATS